MVGLAIIVVLIIMLGWILFAPLVVRIDTIENTYDLRLSGLFKTWLSMDQEGLFVHFWFPFYSYKMDLLRKESSKREKKKAETPGKSSAVKKRSKTKLMRRLLNTLHSFRITVFRAALDTDDYLLNAQLVPLCQLLRRYRFAIDINFQGESYFQLEIRNNLFRLGLAFLEIRKYSQINVLPKQLESWK